MVDMDEIWLSNDVVVAKYCCDRPCYFLVEWRLKMTEKVLFINTKS